MYLEKQVLTKNNNKIELFINKKDADDSSKTILFIGVVHGDEPQGEYLIHNLMKEVLETTNKLLFIPCLNPDGRDLNQRGNSNGVDINRNFPTENWEVSKEKDIYFAGEFAGSEIETRFLVEIIDEFSPDVIFIIHAPYKIVNYDGPAKELAEKISVLNNYPVQADIGYPTPGSFGTYAGVERNIPTITLELPDSMDFETLWLENREAMIYTAIN